jgi:hypothetical protein
MLRKRTCLKFNKKKEHALYQFLRFLKLGKILLLIGGVIDNMIQTYHQKRNSL